VSKTACLGLTSVSWLWPQCWPHTLWPQPSPHKPLASFTALINTHNTQCKCIDRQQHALWLHIGRTEEWTSTTDSLA